MIDWLSSKNEILINTRMPEQERQRLIKALTLLEDLKLKSHVFFATSGSTGRLKWVALSKEAILTSAKAVNLHLDCSSKDIWLNALPEFHVGGLGIIARGFLNQATVISCHFPNMKWNPEYFYKLLDQSQTTLTSLVPTQVFDLISLKLKAPASLRAIVVGGGAISEQLYFSAVRLGWRLLPSYGLTECASQVATAKYGSWSLSEYPLMAPLNHIQFAVNEDGFLKIKSKALFTAYLKEDREFKLYDPKIDGWFTTEDKAIFTNGSIKSVSRGESFIKISGENVDLLRLENILEEGKLALQFKADAAIVALKDERLGHRIHLVVASPVDDEVKKLLEHYHTRVLPFERIAQVLSVDSIPRSALNKVLKNELESLLKN
jgi:o-succinylbenzoate---CoA ligase